MTPSTPHDDHYGRWVDAIDVHHHVVPDFYRAVVTGSDGSSPISGIDYPHWQPDASLEMMARQGIATAVVSVSTPGVDIGDQPMARRLARQLNEYLAGLIADHPGRFGAFAVLPLPDLEAALTELTYALDVLGLDGAGVFTNYRGTYLADPAFDPLLAELDSRGTPVHVHPTTPPFRDQPTFGLPAPLYEFTFETTRLAAQLLYNKTLERHQNLRLIFSHGGGTIPYIAERLTYGPVMGSQLTERLPADPIGSLQRLHYDLANSASPYSLPSLRAFAGPAHILVGTDFPFMPAWSSAGSASRVAAAGFDTDDIALIARENALGLFPRLSETPTSQLRP